MGHNLTYFKLIQSVPDQSLFPGESDLENVLSKDQSIDNFNWYLVLHNIKYIGYVYYNSKTSGLRIFISNKFRGMGYAKYFYKLIMLKNNVPDNKVLAVDINMNNLASIKTHTRLGFKPVHENILTYLRETDELYLYDNRYHVTCSYLLSIST